MRVKRSPLKRSTVPIRKKRAKVRRGRIVDKKYLAFVSRQPCIVSGRMPATVHHVRRFGESKNDRRTVPLMAEYHLYQNGPGTSVEGLGKEKFEEMWGVDLEGEILRLNGEYGAGE